MRSIDVIGVVSQIKPLSSVTIKQSGAIKDRRNITIVDESKYAIQISLWGMNAKKDDYKEGDVIAIRGARVSDYGGKTLNSGS